MSQQGDGFKVTPRIAQFILAVMASIILGLFFFLAVSSFDRSYTFKELNNAISKKLPSKKIFLGVKVDVRSMTVKSAGRNLIQSNFECKIRNTWYTGSAVGKLKFNEGKFFFKKESFSLRKKTQSTLTKRGSKTGGILRRFWNRVKGKGAAVAKDFEEATLGKIEQVLVGWLFSWSLSNLKVVDATQDHGLALTFSSVKVMHDKVIVKTSIFNGIAAVASTFVILLKVILFVFLGYDPERFKKSKIGKFIDFADEVL